MMLGLFLLLAAADDARALIHTAAGKLSGACAGATCAEPPARSAFRIDAGSTGSLDAKDRAFRENGDYCGVVGPRQCTRKPRTIFRTDFTD